MIVTVRQMVQNVSEALTYDYQSTDSIDADGNQYAKRLSPNGPHMYFTLSSHDTPEQV